MLRQGGTDRRSAKKRKEKQNDATLERTPASDSCVLLVSVLAMLAVIVHGAENRGQHRRREKKGGEKETKK
jgi:hypothetical protein